MYEKEIDRLQKENESYKLAIHRLIYERDCAIEDINRNANLTASDDPYYLALGKNAQGETEYISKEIIIAEGKSKEIWRGINNGQSKVMEL